jgi:hypothetical protein
MFHHPKSASRNSSALRLNIAKGMRRVLPLFLFMLALPGCQHTYQEIRHEDSADRPTLSNDATAYIAIPPDLRDKKEAAADSGKMTAEAVTDAFTKYVKRAFIGSRVQSFPESLETARKSQCTYLIYPSVLRWKDHSTEFSGVRDIIEIQIQIVDSLSGAILDTVILKGKSRWMTDGGDVPQDLLRGPIQQYVAALFQPLYVPSGLR